MSGSANLECGAVSRIDSDTPSDMARTSPIQNVRQSSINSSMIDHIAVRSAAHVGVNENTHDSVDTKGLEGLDVDVYDHEVMEKNIMSQMEHAIAVNEAKKRKANLEQLKHQHWFATERVTTIDKELVRLRTKQKITAEVDKQVAALVAERKIKKTKLENVEANLGALEQMLKRDNDSVLPLDIHQSGAMVNNDSLDHDRLVSLGLMTPFGTIINKQINKPRAEDTSESVNSGNETLDDGLNAKDVSRMREIVRERQIVRCKKLPNHTSGRSSRDKSVLTETKEPKSLPATNRAEAKGKLDVHGSTKHTCLTRNKTGGQAEKGNRSEENHEHEHESDVDSDTTSSESDGDNDSEYAPSHGDEDMEIGDAQEDTTIDQSDFEGLSEIGDQEDVIAHRVGKKAKSIKSGRTLDDADANVYWKRYATWAKRRILERRRMALTENVDGIESEGDTKGLTVENVSTVVPSPTIHERVRRKTRAQEHRHVRGKRLSGGMMSENFYSEDDGITECDILNEEYMPDPLSEDEVIGPFKVPGEIWSRLFQYQQVSVQWLWELHGQKVGGIVGDEMGLGKTIQAIAFLAGLKYSNISGREPSSNMNSRRMSGGARKPEGLKNVLIVCPGTILHQWVAEFNTWWPPFRCYILHDSGSFKSLGMSRKQLIENFRKTGDILVTTYQGLKNDSELLHPIRWDYVFLDEGHKIRNPDADITIACKQLKSVHRIILSGSPLQNNLRELWSLFDFVFPGRLGDLPVFMAEFAVPINLGGYANASAVQVQTAYKCALVLRDAIGPYLIRRMKADVRIQLPKKTEQVLFCRLTAKQRRLYRAFLDGNECASILSGHRHLLYGIDVMRKLCNHPHLANPANLKNLSASQYDDYGSFALSGKMAVLKTLLDMWHKDGHRVLLFTQTRQMLDILELFVRDEQNYKYCRMDGNVPVSQRQGLVKAYNADRSIFVFLLTTKVGGLGVNLTGADRVVIYDPDWNPSTDMQARERAWRIGQERNVTVFRLITAGTIEEKMYHRQIFKQFLANRVLKDPKQRRFFKSNDLHELFTLNDEPAGSVKKSETATFFAEPGTEITRDVIEDRVLQEPCRDADARTGSDVRTQPESTIRIKSNTNAEDDPSDAMQITLRVNTIRSNTSEQQRSSTGTESMGTQNHKYGFVDGNEVPGIVSAEVTSVAENDDEKTSAGNEGRKNEKYVSKKERRKTEQRERKRKRGHKTGDYQGSDSEGRLDEYAVASEDDESGILSTLFKNSGMIHSALHHDRIVDGGGQEELLVENEAKRIAKRATEALKNARTLRQSIPVHSVTWTGKRGSTCIAPSRTNSNNSNSSSASSSWWATGSGKRTAPGISSSTVHGSTESNTAISVIKKRFGNVTNSRLVDVAKLDGANPGGVSGIGVGQLSSNSSNNNSPVLHLDSRSASPSRLYVNQNVESEGKTGVVSNISSRSSSRLSTCEERTARADPSVRASSATLVRESDTEARSSTLLDRMRQRAGLGTMDEQDATRVLVAQLRDYISSQPNQRATTKDIVSQFELQLRPSDLGVFRSMLKEIASFQRIRSEGCWKLKADYL
eukprot:CFRG3378T1